MKKNFLLILSSSAAILVIGFYFFNRAGGSLIQKPLPTSSIPSSQIFEGVSYEAINKDEFEVSILAQNLVSPTRIKITPDGKYMLVSQITGEVFYLARNQKVWDKTPNLLTRVDTKFPGFPPDEAGLVGLVFSSEYASNGKVFLLYTFKDKDEKVQNRISVIKISERNGKLFTTKPDLIYQANVAGAASHQITDGLGLSVEGKPHILFLVGEGFDGKRAQDPKLEGGKLILIQEDGSEPLGARPYPENPKVQVLGIRNGFVLVKNPHDKENRILISDTGPDKYDRLIYTNPLAEKPLNFGWNGNLEELAKTIPDPNFSRTRDMVILRLAETRTFTGLVFDPKNEGLVYAAHFGQTGSPLNSPGKEILRGRLTNLGGQPTISFSPIVRRIKDADGKLGNPIGLELGTSSGSLFFADVLEGRIYEIKEVRESE